VIRPDRTRQLPLGVIALAAVLLLLVVLVAALPRSGAPADQSSSPSASASPSPSPTPSPTPTLSATPTPTLSPSPEPVAVLVGAGDIGDCGTSHDSRTGALLDGIEGTVFTAGDNAYENGTAEQFATCYGDAWGSHRDRTRPAPGNHDWNDDLDGYFGYFGDLARGPGGTSWYSYDLGSWHVIVLDSECTDAGGCDPDSDQGRWLAADLKASSATACTVAIWHRPRFSSGRHGNDESVGPFWTALYAARVDVVVNGHDHDYERFAPQTPGGTVNRERGIRQFVAGMGGTNLRRFHDVRAHSEFRDAKSHGVLKLTLRPTDYDWEFIAVGGDVVDRGRGQCH
jgi:acid phosphatase type 7